MNQNILFLFTDQQRFDTIGALGAPIIKTPALDRLVQECIADRTIDFLQDRKKDQPFFLWSSFIKPHPPFEPPTPWNKLYRAAEMPTPFRPDDYQEQLSFWNHVQNRYKYRDAGIDDLLTRTIRAAYYSSISFIDYNIGRILAALGDEIDETFVIFASDHGEMLGDFGAFGKRCMLEAAVRVPLVIRRPDQREAGKRIGLPVSLADLHPTFLEIGQIDTEDRHPEFSDLLGLTEDGATRYVYSQFSENELGHYLIADGRWKYSYCAADEKEWLYDLNGNAGEAHNLIGDSACQGEAERLRSRLIERLARDGYSGAVLRDSWKEYGKSEMPEDPDFGLIFQDPAGLQAKVNELGEYARPILPDSAKDKIDILSGIRRSPQ